MTQKINDKHLAEYKKAFDTLDVNKNGTLSGPELFKLIDSFDKSISNQKLKAIIREVDVNKNFVIDFKEFLSMVEKVNSEQHNEDVWKQTFKMIDGNGDGKISLEELKKFLGEVGQKNDDQSVKEVMKVADLNGDGGISYEEFKKLFDKK